jgi:hypothetical protein
MNLNYKTKQNRINSFKFLLLIFMIFRNHESFGTTLPDDGLVLAELNKAKLYPGKNIKEFPTAKKTSLDYQKEITFGNFRFLISTFGPSDGTITEVSIHDSWYQRPLKEKGKCSRDLLEKYFGRSGSTNSKSSSVFTDAFYFNGYCNEHNIKGETWSVISFYLKAHSLIDNSNIKELFKKENQVWIQGQFNKPVIIKKSLPYCELNYQGSSYFHYDIKEGKILDQEFICMERFKKYHVSNKHQTELKQLSKDLKEENEKKLPSEKLNYLELQKKETNLIRSFVEEKIKDFKCDSGLTLNIHHYNAPSYEYFAYSCYKKIPKTTSICPQDLKAEYSAQNLAEIKVENENDTSRIEYYGDVLDCIQKACPSGFTEVPKELEKFSGLCYYCPKGEIDINETISFNKPEPYQIKTSFSPLCKFTKE